MWVQKLRISPFTSSCLNNKIIIKNCYQYYIRVELDQFRIWNFNSNQNLFNSRMKKVLIINKLLSHFAV